MGRSVPPQGGAAGTVVQDSTLTLPKDTVSSTPSLREMEEKAPESGLPAPDRIHSRCSLNAARETAQNTSGFFLLASKSREDLSFI